jgi:hypothetical protein
MAPHPPPKNPQIMVGTMSNHILDSVPQLDLSKDDLDPLSIAESVGSQSMHVSQSSIFEQS